MRSHDHHAGHAHQGAQPVRALAASGTAPLDEAMASAAWAMASAAVAVAQGNPAAGGRRVAVA